MSRLSRVAFDEALRILYKGGAVTRLPLTSGDCVVATSKRAAWEEVVEMFPAAYAIVPRVVVDSDDVWSEVMAFYVIELTDGTRAYLATVPQLHSSLQTLTIARRA